MFLCLGWCLGDFLPIGDDISDGAPGDDIDAKLISVVISKSTVADVKYMYDGLKFGMPHFVHSHGTLEESMHS